MNKTAMQELIRQCESVLKDGVALSGEDAIKAVICSAKELLPAERQQIEDAYERGGYDEVEGIDILPANYYDSTYKTS